jgi:hypothetical protein
MFETTKQLWIEAQKNWDFFSTKSTWLIPDFLEKMLSLAGKCIFPFARTK